jgi:excisionase family DNA binding protein
MALDHGYCTIAEVAEAVRASPRSVRRWIAEGAVQGVQLPGRQWRVPRSEVERLLKTAA